MSRRDEAFDFWYAVNNTEVLKVPSRHLETFGTTRLTYFLVSELMDTVGSFRVREGVINAAPPEIITLDSLGDVPMEGFSDQEAHKYRDWLRENQPDLRMLKYGFRIRKQEVKDVTLHEPMEQILENIAEDIQRREDPYTAVVSGVEEPWEVCLIKLMIEVIQESAAGNVSDLTSRQLLGPTGAPMKGPGLMGSGGGRDSDSGDELRRQVDAAFLAASRDANLIPDLHERLVKAGLFEDYEDRFFALVRASKQE